MVSARSTTGLSSTRTLLEQHPRYAVAFILFLEDELAFPLEAPLLHVQDELVQFLPRLAKSGLNIADRFVIDRVVGQVEDDRAMAFCHQIHHALKRSSVQFESRVSQICHAASVQVPRPALLAARSAKPGRIWVRGCTILVAPRIGSQSL